MLSMHIYSLNYQVADKGNASAANGFKTAHERARRYTECEAYYTLLFTFEQGLLSTIGSNDAQTPHCCISRTEPGSMASLPL